MGWNDAVTLSGRFAGVNSVCVFCRMTQALFVRAMVRHIVWDVDPATLATRTAPAELKPGISTQANVAYPFLWRVGMLQLRADMNLVTPNTWRTWLVDRLHDIIPSRDTMGM